MKKIGMRLGFVVAALAAGAAHADADYFSLGKDQALSVAIGTEYSSGKYGQTSNTNVLLVPISVSYREDKTTVSLVVPYLRISGPGNIIGAARNQVQVNGAVTPPRAVSSGLGDVVLGLTQNMYANPNNGWAIDLTGNIKFGTADSVSGLGTGETDYALQTDVAKYFDEFDLFGTLGWRKMGNPPGITFKNPGYSSIGAGYSSSENLRFGMAYDFRQRVIAGTANFAEVLAFVNYQISKPARLQIYALKGLTDNSPDKGLGTTVNFAY